MSLVIRGVNSEVSQALLTLLPHGERVGVLGRAGTVPVPELDEALAADRFLFCQGLIYPRPLLKQSEEEISESFNVNCAHMVSFCDALFKYNDTARVCIVGSESGYNGSYDGSYVLAKAAMHAYVETKRLRTPDQQLVCVSPGIIGDAGMTHRRADLENLKMREDSHPKKRFISSLEVAKLIHFLLYIDKGYISNTVIRMHGGDKWR